MSFDFVLEEIVIKRFFMLLLLFFFFLEFGVVFKWLLDCYYFKKNSVRNIMLGFMKYGKYGVLDF